MGTKQNMQIEKNNLYGEEYVVIVNPNLTQFQHTADYQDN